MKDEESTFYIMVEGDFRAFDLTNSKSQRGCRIGEAHLDRTVPDVGYVGESFLDRIEREARNEGDEVLLEKVKILKARLGV